MYIRSTWLIWGQIFAYILFGFGHLLCVLPDLSVLRLLHISHAVCWRNLLQHCMFQTVNFLTRCMEAPRCFSIFVSLRVTNVGSLNWFSWYLEVFCYFPSFSSLVGIWQVTGHFAWRSVSICARISLPIYWRG